MATVRGPRARVEAARYSCTSDVGTSSAAALLAAEKDRRDNELAVTASPMRAYSEERAFTTPLSEPLGEVDGGGDFGADGDATFDLHPLPLAVPQSGTGGADNGHIDLLVDAADDTLSELVAAPPPPRPSTMGFAILVGAAVYAVAVGVDISSRARAAPTDGKAAAARAEPRSAVSDARALRNAAASTSPSGCLDSLQRFLQKLAVRTLGLLGIFVALLVVLSQAISSEPMVLVVIVCALIGIFCVWWRASAVRLSVSFGGACRAIRGVVRRGGRVWVGVVVAAAVVVPGVEAVDYPSAAAKAACDVWSEGLTSAHCNHRIPRITSGPTSRPQQK